ncbi:MAG: alpha-ketoacid dehydrogenase subunit beta [Anaerolineae bacterium]|nr:alpha-ketoacid dehydrogenase subunit beta [Anaerolineae bacterium]
MREMTYAQAIREALAEEMRRDKNVFLMGEDIAIFEGAFGVTGNLWKEFGLERVRDTPISEAAIVGAGVGAAIMGKRPVVEIMFGDFLPVGMDQIVNQAAKARYMSGGKVSVPLTIRVTTGATGAAAGHHSQSFEGWLIGIPGLKIAVPASPEDAKGLLKTAIRGEDPVIFFEHKRLYGMRGAVPEGDFTIPFGKARLVRRGKDVTLIGISGMVPTCLEAAEELQREGVDAEVIDPRTLVPLDRDLILESAVKTGRVVVVQEAHSRGGAAAEIAALIAEHAMDWMNAPILRVGARNVPIPYSPVLEQEVLPGKEDIIAAVRKLF